LVDLVTTTSDKIVIWYFADPMCSWCWGFSPVIDKIRSAYSDQISIKLNLGGLRPGTTQAITKELRDEILHHWHAVHKMTGQEFKFENAMPEGFIYDTEIPSRAVTLVASLFPELALDCFSAIQAAFYRDGKDVTSKAVLKEITQNIGIVTAQFDQLFEAPHIKQTTQQHFNSTHQAGIRAFPAMIWQNNDNFESLCNGYVSFEKISGDIEKRLNQLQNKNG
jgi:putative protein-disulfide isomerase